jgi:hypothetical protein
LPDTGKVTAIDDVVVVENDAAACVKPVVPCDDVEALDDDDSDFNASKIVDTAPRAASMLVPYAKPPMKDHGGATPVHPPQASSVPQVMSLINMDNFVECRTLARQMLPPHRARRQPLPPRAAGCAVRFAPPRRA